MSDYERKIAVRIAKADARKAVKRWYELGNISIDEIIKSYGYRDADWLSTYKFKKTVWTGMEGYVIKFDTYNLIHKDADKIDVEVEKLR